MTRYTPKEFSLQTTRFAYGVVAQTVVPAYGHNIPPHRQKVKRKSWLGPGAICEEKWLLAIFGAGRIAGPTLAVIEDCRSGYNVCTAHAMRRGNALRAFDASRSALALRIFYLTINIQSAILMVDKGWATLEPERIYTMCNTKRKYQVTIMSAVDELQRCYRALNKLYYHGVLEDVVITIQSDVKRSAYAWISVAKVWNDKTESNYHEINIVAEYLNRDPVEVVASLLHEMAHLYCMQLGIQDVSRGGQYHNGQFKVVAELHGLTCEHNKTYGWTITKATEETAAWVKLNVRTGCFRMNRSQVWADGKPKTVSGEDDNGKPAVTKKGGSNIRKYKCPDCGLIIRASKNIDGKVKCIECDKVMEYCEK